MKKQIFLFAAILLTFNAWSQITYQNDAITNISLKNPSGSSNGYYHVDLTLVGGRAAGGLSIGLFGDLSQRYWLTICTSRTISLS